MITNLKAPQPKLFNTIKSVCLALVTVILFVICTIVTTYIMSPSFANTAYSIELNAATHIPEWNKEIRIMLEEEALFDGKEVRYLDGRQTSFHTIYSK